MALPRSRAARAAQAKEPIPRASSSGRRSGPPGCDDGLERRRSGWCRASSGSRSCQPASTRSGSTNHRPALMSRPRLRAAICIQSAPSPSRASAISHRPSPGRTVWVGADRGVSWTAGAAAAEAVTTIGVDAPATDATASGAPALDRARTPMAMRAATRSSGEATPSGRISPRRTCTVTPLINCDAQAAHAIQAASASAHNRSRGSGCHVWPRPPDSGFPTTSTKTRGTAVKASRAAKIAPRTSALRLPTGGADRDRVRQRRRLRRWLAHRGQAAAARVGKRGRHGG